MIRISVILLATLACLHAQDGPVLFSRDILPLLSDHCFQCHGPDANDRHGDLRLDDEDDAKRPRDPFAVVTPHDSARSLIMDRLRTSDPDTVMPPPELGRPLSPEQITLLERWIDEGAPWGRHWAFEPIARPPLPDRDGGEHPIDRFVREKLDQAGLVPNPRASRATLARRLALDLTGLPPSRAEREAFLKDPSPNAWARLVDQLLESPAYGERMAWDWLEAARYADTNGYQGDRERTMWPWRDWVVRAFNANLPYDQFTIWQLAGDLLPKPTRDQLLATGFNRNHMINGEGGRIPEENRVDYVMDMTETMGTVWLGLTLNCARCHDHKFDPLTQSEYYQFTAFFNQTPVDGSGGDPQTPPVLEVDTTFTEAAPKVMIMRDRDETRPTYILDRGLYTARGETVDPNGPATLPPLTGRADGKRDRLDLARWLVSHDHPLTARVTVNRFWQMLFGIGLVKTAEDFGVQAEYPLQRELLDWLAAEFMDSGWDVKHLLRTIVTSAVYQQRATVTPALLEADPDNRYLARGARFRLPSWMLRDQALAAAGLLVPQLGGPPVKPYQPDGLWAEATFGKKRYEPDSGKALYRRSLYTFWRRIVGPAMFFDVAKRQVCEVKPLRTNTPMQALNMLNDTTYVEAARALAEDLLRSCENDRERLDQASQSVLGRLPHEDERALWERSLTRARNAFEADPTAAEAFLSHGASARDATLKASDHATWTAICLNLLNLDEALTKE